jgi:5-hydroxyisourate hydrolase
VISTHVLDTERGEPAEGVIVELTAARRLAPAQTNADGRIAELSPEPLGAGTYRIVFHPPSTFFRRVELKIAVEDPERHPCPAARLALLVRGYRGSWPTSSPRFEGRGARVERLAREDPHSSADDVIASLGEERIEALDAHPPSAGAGLLPAAALSRAPTTTPGVLAELAELNAAYEERFGFRFVVFVNRRPRAEIVPSSTPASPARATRS